jgi:hypothetical protein
LLLLLLWLGMGMGVSGFLYWMLILVVNWDCWIYWISFSGFFV